MKKILITGANSYIGTSFMNWVCKWPDKYKVDSISVKTDEWKMKSFEGYDVVFHVAAIVHVKENDIDKYFKINRDLALDIAKKAKQEGVKQFIFLSTMGVYGTETGHITKDTEARPKTPYAKSKYEAEKLLYEINDNNFKVAVLRPPIVYGKDCRGNYPRLASMALKLPFFPDIKNQRSMIYIDNLSEFIRLIIDDCAGGFFFPQNRDYVCTSDLGCVIAQIHKKKILMTKVFNPIIKILKTTTVKKVFGCLTYDFALSQYDKSYDTCSFLDSIKETEVK
ncbi:MAG: NAD-dependent epimerase/dehydratase family protein [Sedimentibacter saalensis]|uniref:NAD-dependent epimerase/dehydratase family protein n=1 Tax=Sedimentibacter saalensis TaxID=130788 RepID=UPI003159056C